MKRFILKILLYFSIVIFICSVITIITDQGLKKSGYKNMREWNDVFGGKVNADVLIQGSSRAWVHYSTSILDSALNVNSYNLGIDGTPFDFQYARHKVYMEHNTPPKLIIQNVDNGLMVRNMLVFEREQYLPYISDNNIEAQYKKNQPPVQDLYIPFLKYMGFYKLIPIGFKEFFGIQHYESDRYKGYKGQDFEWDGTAMEERLKGDKIVMKPHKDVEELFIDFLSECKQKEIQVLLVHAPIYHRVINHTENFEGILAYYQDFADRYDFHFLDYSLDSLSYDTAYFYNSGHMNKKGAELFTRKLAEDIKELGILED